MRRSLKKFACSLGVAMILTVVSPVFSFVAEAKEQTININGQVYEFNKKSEYEIDSSSAISTTDKVTTLGSLFIEGDISKNYSKNGVDAYEIADDTVFSVLFNYSSKLKDADSMEWHLTEDSEKNVNGISLDEKIYNGAIILQTSLDGNKWTTSTTITDVTSNITFNKDNGINNIQLANGCYYRVIVAYELEKQLDDTSFLFIDTSDFEYKKNAEVYKFYASYKDTDTTPTGKKFKFYVGADQSTYTVRTKTNNYAGSETIDVNDPHYNWDLGYFCLSGYTDKGDADDVYLKKVGNKVKLTFRLDHDINNLHGNSDLIIESDKDGSDEEFKVLKHNMKHGELIIKHTDSENNTNKVIYSDYLAALASPGADTSIQLFEEGDYEVHLDYAITDNSKFNKFDNTTYYRMSFSFKIRNANCMVYIFDSKSGAELGNGAVTENGFRIDTAKSSYPKLQVKKEILNNTQSGLMEDTRFNGAASNGETFTDEGIYTIKAYNRYDDKLEPAVKTIYVGSNNILTAYTKHLNTSEQYTIAELNNMVHDGWTITDSGDLIEPVVETTTVTTASPETTTSKTETTTTVTSAEAIAAEAPDSSVPKEENTNKSALPIVGGGVGAVTLGGVLMAALKKKK